MKAKYGGDEMTSRKATTINRRKLLATGAAELVEDSPFEPFWGTGRDGQGANWAGRVLMEIRARLRQGEE